MATVTPKRYIYIFLAVVFASVAAMGSYQIFTTNPVAKSVTVFVAKSVIPVRTAIGPSELEAKKFPMAVYPDAAANPLGKVVTVGIVPGEVIVNNMLIQGSVPSGLSAEVPASMYAMSIPINQVTGVNGAVLTGDRIDLVVSNGSGGATDVLPNVLVLDKTAGTLTIEVFQLGALTVIQAEQHGTLTVLLRGISSD
ncbi:MAG TPA: Flp pilus assembly protein CpaB [Spirochaetia bacterium]|nr:Flp pilus assembly protein CpaB [Spirochaetia bacterium]